MIKKMHDLFQLTNPPHSPHCLNYQNGWGLESWAAQDYSSKALQWPSAKASLAVKEERDLRHLDIRTLAGELEGFRAVQTMNLNHEAMADLHLK